MWHAKLEDLSVNRALGVARTASTLARKSSGRECFSAASADEASDYRLGSERVLYASTVDQDQPLREVDQVVSVYSEYPAGDFGAQMMVSAVIESKRREGVQVGGCAMDRVDRAPGILHGDLAWLRELPPLEHVWPSNLQRPESFPVVVEEESWRGGLRTSKEQLVQNAALAAVDYVIETIDFAGPDRSMTTLRRWGIDALLEAEHDRPRWTNSG